MYNSNDPGLNFHGRLSTVFSQNYEFSKIFKKYYGVIMHSDWYIHFNIYFNSSEAHLYQQRLVLFDNSDEFFKMIDQFNKIVIKYSAVNIFSERDKANINIKSTTLKSSSVKTNDKSLDSENFNHSDLEFQVSSHKGFNTYLYRIAL